MTKRTMHLNPAAFAAIQAGTKTIEVRLNDPKRQLVEVGDMLTFTNLADPKQQETARVVSLQVFRTFADLYQYFPHEAVGSLVTDSLAQIVAETHATYAPEREKRWGVLAIGVQVMR